MKSQKHLEWELENMKMLLENDPHDETFLGWIAALEWCLAEPRLMKCKECGTENDYFDIGDAGWAECSCGWTYKSASGIGYWENKEGEAPTTFYSA